MTDTLASTTAIPPTSTRVRGATATDTARDENALATEAERFLTFSLGGEVFALPILAVTEILEYRPLTVVPMMPDLLRGVLNLRGRVVPVVDLAARFGRGRTEVATRTSIVIVENRGHDATGHDGDGDGDGGDHQDMGILVDGVNKVVYLASDAIEPPPAFGAGIRTDFIAGMARHGGQFVIVLDAARILSTDELGLLARAGTEAQPTAQ